VYVCVRAAHLVHTRVLFLFGLFSTEGDAVAAINYKPGTEHHRLLVLAARSPTASSPGGIDRLKLLVVDHCSRLLTYLLTYSLTISTVSQTTTVIQ